MANHLPENISAAQLKSYLNVTELRAQLLAQICKDVGLEGIEADVAVDSFFTDLQQQLSGIVKHIILNQPQTLANIVYRVDLHERKTRNLLTNPQEMADEALAAAIIEREMKKVIIRNMYNGNIKL